MEKKDSVMSHGGLGYQMLEVLACHQSRRELKNPTALWMPIVSSTHSTTLRVKRGYLIKKNHKGTRSILQDTWTATDRVVLDHIGQGATFRI
jgi:hypothetical protein